MNPRAGIDRVEVNNEAKIIALDYIYYRLRQNGFTWNRCPPLPDPSRPALIMRELGEEFEKRYATTFGEWSTNLNLTELTTYQNFLGVCEVLFKGENYYKVEGNVDVKWGRIVALYVFGGWLAVECAKRNITQQLPYIADWIFIYVRNHLSFWICRHGGWDGLTEYYETRHLNQKWESMMTTLGTAGAVCGAVALATVLWKHF